MRGAPTLLLTLITLLAQPASAAQVGPLQSNNNLADLPNPAAARSNLGLAPSATTDTTNASNITTGTLPPAQLPTPTTGTLGGVEASAGVSHQWIYGISTAGLPLLSQPAAADISGLGGGATANIGTSGATLPLLNGVNTWAGAQTFSGGLTGTLTGAASLNLLLTGGTLTGALTAPGITSTGNFNTTGTFGVTVGNTATSNGVALSPAASGSASKIQSNGPSGTAQPLTIQTGSNGTGALLTIQSLNNGAMTLNSGTGAFTLNGGGLAMNQNLAQSVAYTFAGSSSTATAANLFQFETAQVSGFPNDGGSPALGLIHILSSTTGNGDFGFKIWEHVVTGYGSKVGFEAAIDNLGQTPQNPDTWAASTSYAAGKVVLVGYNVMHTLSAGTSGTSSPDCSGSKTICNDGAGGLTWHYDGILGTFNQYIGQFAAGGISANIGGTSGALMGNAFGTNEQCFIDATWTVGLVCDEKDFGLSQPALSRLGLSLVVRSAGSVQASVDDVGLAFGLQTGGAPLRNLEYWGNRNNQPVIDPNGIGIRAWPSGGGLGVPTLMAAAGAIDLSAFNASGSAPDVGGGFLLRGPTSQLLGNGDAQFGYGVIHATAAGSSYDVSGYKVTAVNTTPLTGGTGWATAGKWADCTSGASGANDHTIVKVDSVSGGSVTLIELVQGGFGPTNSVTTETCYSEQMAGALDGAGNPTMPTTPFTIGVTWSRAAAAPVLALGGVADAIVGTQAAMSTSATVGFLGMPFSNGTPSGTPTNNTLGAETEVNATSKTLNIYIPGVGWYHAALTSGAG